MNTSNDMQPTGRTTLRAPEPQALAETDGSTTRRAVTSHGDAHAQPAPRRAEGVFAKVRQWLPPRTLEGAIGLLLALLLIGPKVCAISFTNQFLWGNVHGSEALLVLAQDMLLWWIIFGFSVWMLPRIPLRGWVAWWVTLGALTFLLLVDMRVRQLWLKPLDLALVLYYLEELSSLQSSTGTFFSGKAGFGFTFRRILFFAGLTHFALGWLMLRLRAAIATSRDPLGRQRWHKLAWSVGALAALAVAAASPRQMYSLQDNMVVEPLVTMLAQEEDEDAASAIPFEQPLRPAKEVLASPRVRLADAPPFENLVIVVLESFRYDQFADEDHSKTPTLRRLATEGLHAKAYVSVPHSSKAIYAIISGRSPSARVEILEAVPLEQSSVIRTLRDRRGATTSAFSAAYLGFENIEGLLRSLGIDEPIGPRTLQERSRRRGSRMSYGIDDVVLVDVPSRTISEHLAEQGRRPFVSVLLTLNTHHPYVYPGKLEREDDGKEHYDRSLEYADAVLGEIVQAFVDAELDRNTLFVFVGDHGESFGEHGSFIHNNSLYEEEITVPLVFWSSDGRLKHDEHLEARQIDVAPTIADLMGLEEPGFDTQGVSLLRSTKRPATFVATFFEGVSQVLVEDETKYMYWPSSGRVVRFDLRADPGEREPIAVEGDERIRIISRLRSAAAYEDSVWVQ